MVRKRFLDFQKLRRSAGNKATTASRSNFSFARLLLSLCNIARIAINKILRGCVFSCREFDGRCCPRLIDCIEKGWKGQRAVCACNAALFWCLSNPSGQRKRNMHFSEKMHFLLMFFHEVIYCFRIRSIELCFLLWQLEAITLIKQGTVVV